MRWIVLGSAQSALHEIIRFNTLCNISRLGHRCRLGMAGFYEQHVLHGHNSTKPNQYLLWGCVTCMVLQSLNHLERFMRLDYVVSVIQKNDWLYRRRRHTNPIRVHVPNILYKHYIIPYTRPPRNKQTICFLWY